MRFSIRLLYLYLFAFVGLIIFVIGTIRILQLGMNVYVFRGADEYSYFTPEPAPLDSNGREIKYSQEERSELEKSRKSETKRQRQRELSGALSMILVGFPLYKFHWRIISKENSKG